MGNFINMLEQQATGGLSGAIGGAMGLALGAINDKRQLRQQKRLNEQQMGIDKQMTDYNYQKQMEMWEKTNYKGQMEQLKKAGLNPALLYGMSGGGGITTGTGGASVNAAKAPAGGGELGMGIQQGMQMQMMQAQIENIKADTNKKNTEATFTGGAQTEETRTRIATGLQNIEESKTRQSVQNLDAKLKEIEAAYLKDTLDDRIEKLGYETDKAFTELELIRNQAFVSRNTMNEQVQLIKNSVIQSLATILNTRADTQNKYAQNANIKADTKLKGTQNLVQDATFKNIIQNTMMGWDTLSIKEKELRIDQMMSQYNTDISREVKNDVIKLIDGIYDYKDNSRTEVKGFGGKRY